MKRRLKPTKVTVRLLFARSGNQCAFPECRAHLIEDDDLLVGEIAHITAALPGGPRYDPTLTREQRRDPDNLLLLCLRHHRVVDARVELFTAETLRKMKADHEATVVVRMSYWAPAVVVQAVAEQLDSFWRAVEFAQREEHPVPEYAVPVDGSLDFEELLGAVDHAAESIRRHARTLVRLDREVRRPHSLFEVSCLGLPNLATRLAMTRAHLAVRHWADLHAALPSDAEVALRLEEAKAELLRLTQSAGLAD